MKYHLLKSELGHRLETVTSTNEWIKNPEIPAGSWVLADQQTSGKGRGKNIWQTLGDDFIIFSGKIQIPASEISLPLFSIFTAAAVLRTLFSYYPNLESELSIKWPNDIYREEKKIGGILIESEIQAGVCTVIIGLGINLYGKDVPADLQSRVCFLLDATPLEGTAERITHSILEAINSYIIKLIDPSQILNELIWIEAHSLLKNKVIETEWDGKIVRGKVLGIDENGFLIILTEKGEKFELMDTSPSFRVI
jgi:BirA family biotin operon repressor/biotin-[acetyl-CoA-carboxylase] ligase